MSKSLISGWILQFDVKAAWEFNLDNNPAFIPIDDYDYLEEKLFPQVFAYEFSQSSIAQYESTLESHKENFFSCCFYKLSQEYDSLSPTEVCDLIRLHSHQYPEEMFLDGNLYPDDIKGHRTRSLNKKAAPAS